MKDRYGKTPAVAMTYFMAKTNKGKDTISRNSLEAMETIKRKTRDPKMREKAMLGAVTASAVAYYSYTHQDELKYRALNKGLETITVPVNGQNKNLGQLYTEQVLQIAPSLEGCQLADDPAAVLAYGVATVGKEDIINRLEVVPDGKGGMQTIDHTLNETIGPENAVTALNLSSSVEGMAMSAADNGDFGRYGSQFAATYNTMESTGEKI